MGTALSRTSVAIIPGNGQIFLMSDREEWKASPWSKYGYWRTFVLQLNLLCTENIHHSLLLIADCSLRCSFKETPFQRLDSPSPPSLYRKFTEYLGCFCCSSIRDILTSAFLHVISVSVVTPVRSIPKVEPLWKFWIIVNNLHNKVFVLLTFT